MKTRNGFVSNSSSSSFVVIGTRMTSEQLTKIGWRDGDGDTVDAPEQISIYYDGENGYIVGMPLCDAEDQGLSYKEINETELADIMKQVSSQLKCPVKLMMGTRPT